MRKSAAMNVKSNDIFFFIKLFFFIHKNSEGSNLHLTQIGIMTRMNWSILQHTGPRLRYADVNSLHHPHQLEQSLMKNLVDSLMMLIFLLIEIDFCCWRSLAKVRFGDSHLCFKNGQRAMTGWPDWLGWMSIVKLVSNNPTSTDHLQETTVFGTKIYFLSLIYPRLVEPMRFE